MKKITLHPVHIVRSVFRKFFALPFRKKAAVTGIILLAAGGIAFAIIRNNIQSQPKYETTKVAKETLTVSISGSGTITTGNTTSISTGATGTVTAVYVKNGDTVKKGEKIAELTLDEYGEKRLSAAWLSYINALNAVKTAQAQKTSDDIAMWNARQAILDAEDAIEYKNNHPVNPKTNEEYTLSERTVIDKSLDLAHQTYDAAELKYKDDDAQIQNANVRVSSAWYDYQQVSSTIIAPQDGLVENLMLAVGTNLSNSSDSSISISDGTTVSSSNSSSNTLTASSQNIGTVRDVNGQFKATISMSEVDVPNIKSDQDVTITMDAFPDNTFTGKVLAVDTSGAVSSGVTTYAVTVLMDPTTINIYPKMAVNANIITLVKPNVILVPTTAIDTVDSTSTVQVMKNGKPVIVTVTVGSANDTQTEISSGLSEGDEVVTGTVTPTAASAKNTKTTGSSTSTKSIFSGQGGGMMGGMGGPPGN